MLEPRLLLSAAVAGGGHVKAAAPAAALADPAEPPPPLAPVLDSLAAAAVTVNEGQPAANSGNWSDAEGDAVTLVSSVGTVVKNDDGTWNWSWTPAAGPADTQVVTVTATDDDGATSLTFDLAVLNVAPTVAAVNNAVAADEGTLAVNSGTWSDVAGDAVTLSASVGTVVRNDDGTWGWSWTTADGPNDSQTVTITATDKDGGSAAASFELAVKNVAPQNLAIAGPAAGFEGDTMSYTGSATDVAGDTLSYAWDVSKDGVWGYASASASASAAFSFVPDDNATYLVKLTVSDEDGGATVLVSDPVVVENVAPTIDTVAITSPIDEDGTAELSGTYSDPGTADTHVLDVDWNGDGVYDERLAISGGTFSVTHQYLDDDPTGTPSDTYNVGVRVTDDDGGADDGAIALTVNNVAPVVVSLGMTPDTIDENGTSVVHGVFTDPGTLDTYTVVINWGDGSTPTELSLAAGTREFTAEHQYLDDNPTGTPSDVYTVAVTVTDDDTGNGDGDADITVNNVPPVIQTLVSSAPGVGDGAEGRPVTISGTFSDVGTLDTHTAVIDWGDGSTSAAVITQGAGSGSFAGEHVYTAGGIYTVTVTLADDDTGTDVGTSTAVISGVGVVDGVLYAIGTDAADKVQISQIGKTRMRVNASFLTERGKVRTFDLAGIREIQVLTGDANDQATVAGNVALPLLMDGGAGNDKLNAGAGPAILMGSEGDDFLNGGKGRDILIGGDGKDRLVGGPGDDILIAGKTSFDANDDALTKEFAAALQAVAKEWTSTRAVAVRAANIGGTGSGERLNGDTFLQLGVTAMAGDAKEILTGASGENWYFGGKVAGKTKKDLVASVFQAPVDTGKGPAEKAGSAAAAGVAAALPAQATGAAPASASNKASDTGAANHATRGVSDTVRPAATTASAVVSVLDLAPAVSTPVTPTLPAAAVGAVPASASSTPADIGAAKQDTRGNSAAAHSK